MKTLGVSNFFKSHLKPTDVDVRYCKIYCREENDTSFQGQTMVNLWIWINLCLGYSCNILISKCINNLLVWFMQLNIQWAQLKKSSYVIDEILLILNV
jgi:Pyruvate/2-oxoacid:ferredoxin oxidoreductase delta subunit